MTATFLIGFFGSLHCVGMCGPIMMSVTIKNPRPEVLGLYHAGRLFTYVLLGLFLGTIGQFIQLIAIQKTAVLVIGVLIFALYALPRVKNNLERYYYRSWIYKQAQKLIARDRSGMKKWTMSGIANGLFPCGLTYIAAANATLAPSVLASAGHMMAFGLGTLPALLALSYSGQLFQRRLQPLIPRALQFIGMMAGLLLIYRGLSDHYPDFDAQVREGSIALIARCGF